MKFGANVVGILCLTAMLLFSLSIISSPNAQAEPTADPITDAATTTNTTASNETTITTMPELTAWTGGTVETTPNEPTLDEPPEPSTEITTEHYVMAGIVVVVFLGVALFILAAGRS